MLGIDKMTLNEIHELLPYVKYAHLDCIREGKHYVMSMEYYIADSDVYLFTVEDIETKNIDQNPEVCLQVENIYGLRHWCSALINGRASRLTNPVDIDQAMHSIEDHNSLLSHVMNRTWTDALGHSEIMATYRFHLGDMNGRTARNK